MNLCRPDDRKSCAACCGLYNVPAADRQTLSSRLLRRTRLFQRTSRTADAIQDFESYVRASEGDSPLDVAIHVCGFTGFIDPFSRCVGCMLHPQAPGNNGVDFRGLCHYGSMACKTFFCPAWDKIPDRYLAIICDVVDDWYLYGLVVTDIEFVMTLFGLLEESLGKPVHASMFVRGESREVLNQMVSWKDCWPLNQSSPIRRSSYYRDCSPPVCRQDTLGKINRITENLRFTFDLPVAAVESKQLMEVTLRCLITSLRQ